MHQQEWLNMCGVHGYFWAIVVNFAIPSNFSSNFSSAWWSAKYWFLSRGFSEIKCQFAWHSLCYRQSFSDDTRKHKNMLEVLLHGFFKCFCCMPAFVETRYFLTDYYYYVWPREQHIFQRTFLKPQHYSQKAHIFWLVFEVGIYQRRHAKR